MVDQRAFRYSNVAVIGGGLAGLAAAMALAPHAARIAVFDRDGAVGSPAPRPGAPQGRQLHIFLAGGLEAFERLDPGFGAALRSAGATPLRLGLTERFESVPARDLGRDLTAQSRPFLESVALARLRAMAGDRLELALGSRVEALDPVRARGASDGEPFDLTIDAAGGGSKLALNAWRARGIEVEEQWIEAPVTYATALIAKPEGIAEPDGREPELGSHAVPCVAPSGRGGIVVPIEGDRCFLALAGRFDQSPPTDIDGFRAFAATVGGGHLGAIAERARFLEKPIAYRFAASRWRRFDRCAAPHPSILPLGDAMARLCPVYGQGVSLAAQQACALRDAIEAAGPDGPARGYLDGAASAIERGWLNVAHGDFAFPGARGARPAALARRRALYARAARRLVAEPAVHRAFALIDHLAADDGDLASVIAAPRSRAQDQIRSTNQ